MGKESSHNAGRHRRCGFNPWVGKISYRRKQQPTPAFLPEDSMDRGARSAAIAELDTLTEHTHTHTHTPVKNMGAMGDIVAKAINKRNR